VVLWAIHAEPQLAFNYKPAISDRGINRFLVENITVDTALELKGLTKVFGKVRAVDGIDLVVPRGAMYGIIGPSGAGKTTAIRMIMSILFPDSGTLSVLGHGSALDAKDRIGYLPEERGVYRKMRVRAFLTFLAQLKGVPATGAAARASKLLSRVGLADVEEKKCEDLSKACFSAFSSWARSSISLI
jgi:ABC-2 type transport system ATP-binding protein